MTKYDTLLHKQILNYLLITSEKVLITSLLMLINS